MNKQSLVFITRPLELIGAIEAREQFEIQNAILVINYDKVDVNTHQFLLKKYPNWREIIWLEIDNNYYAARWLKLLKKLRKNDYEFFLTRSFRTASYFVHNLNYEKMFLLDDGSATINIHKSLLERKNLNNRFHLFKGEENDPIRSKQKKRMLKLWLQGINVSNPVAYVNFFTFYDIKSNEHCSVVKNEFKWLNNFKTNNIKKLDDVVYFIGNNAIGEGVVNYYDYLETLVKVKSFYEGSIIYYLPHPNEAYGFCNFIEKYLGFNIKKNKVNLELSFLSEKELPSIVAGTVSTALTTLSYLYKDEFSIEFFNLNEEKIANRWKDQIKGMCAYQSERLIEQKLNYEL